MSGGEKARRTTLTHHTCWRRAARPLLTVLTSYFIYWNRENPEKRPIPLPSAPPHSTDPLVLVYSLLAFKPSLGGGGRH